jgi:hypothetical protein
VNGLINAIGEENLIVFEAEVLGYDALDGFALRVDSQTLRGELLQLSQDRGTGSEGVLVEVEAEGVATGEWRMILGHGQYGLAWLY